MSKSSTKVLVASFLIMALMISACEDTSFVGDPLLSQVHLIDPTFREFYDLFGAEETLGPGISPLFAHRNIYYQYTTAALLMHDPGAPASQRFSLAPLGMDMDIDDPPVSPPDDPKQRYVEGHIIFNLFVPLYEELGGARYVGVPISEVHYNPEKRRYEQFFANLGFYWLEGDSPDQVHLLAYGAWKCDAYCRSPHPESSVVILPHHTAKRFNGAVDRLGADFTGRAITDEYATPDGFNEQVFENVVMVVDPEQPSRVMLRSITERLGYMPDPMVAPSQPKDYSFYEVQANRGYNVPKRFEEYIIQHGGYEVSGAPIGEIAHLKDAVYQQCFTNLCIQAFLDALGNIAVRPAPLGYTYKLLPIQAVIQSPAQPITLPEVALPVEEVQAEPDVQVADQPMPEPTVETFTDDQVGQIVVQVWESFPMVSPNQNQEIGVSIFQNNQPVLNVEPDLTIQLPDGSTRQYYMYPTGNDGQTRMTIEPIDAPGGTLIPYKVCIYGLGGQAYCTQDSFLIW